MVVYLDFLWLLNWGMNWWLLWATAKALRRRVSLEWIMLVAGGGAVVSLVWLLITSPLWVEALLKMLVAIIMVRYTFSPKGVWQTVEITLLFMLISTICAGVSLALALLTSRGLPESWPEVSLFIVLGGPLLMTMVMQRLWSSVGGYLRRAEQSAKFRFVLQGAVVELFGILDTGNVLVEPITYRPVVVVDAQSVKDSLPLGLMALLAQWDELSEKSLHFIPDALATRLTLIPFTAVAGGGLMVGIRPDSCSILVHGAWRGVDAVVGFSPSELSPPMLSGRGGQQERTKTI
ncbi:MAG: Sporulation sigma-E factor-processing peptidase [Firmicutes bacterium]|nr:Sporulation sigma-E factor-processing peptidase [Bacillota bacterium]